MGKCLNDDLIHIQKQRKKLISGFRSKNNRLENILDKNTYTFCTLYINGTIVITIALQTRENISRKIEILHVSNHNSNNGRTIEKNKAREAKGQKAVPMMSHRF